MSFIVRKVHGDEEVVNVLYAGLVSDRVKHIVIVRRNSIELQNVDDSKLKLRKKIPIWDNIIDCAPFQPFGDVPGEWLVLTTDSNKLVIVAFKKDLEHIVIEDIPLNKEGKNVNLCIVPKTLCVDNQNYIAFYTREGTFCVYDIHKPKDMKNFEKAFKTLSSKSGKKNINKLFNDPKFYDISRNKTGVPVSLESISSHPHDVDDRKTFSILYRNDVYEYFSDFLQLGKSKTIFEQNHEFFEASDMSSIMVPFEKSLGVFYFATDTILLKLYDPLSPCLELDHDLKNANESTIKPLISHDGKCHFVGKVVQGLDKKVSSAIAVTSNDINDPFMILFVDSIGKLYLTETDFELEQDQDFLGTIEKLILKSWKVHDFKSGNLNPGIQNINQLSEDEFVFSSQLGIQLLKIDFTKRSYRILDSVKSSPPILDFNITGTNIPKVQTVGASEFDSGFIKTEFNGFDITTNKKVKLNLKEDDRITSFWKLNDILIINELYGSNFKLLDISGTNSSDLNEYHQLTSISGAMLDFKSTSKNEFLVVTDSGIYKNDTCLKEADIANAVITENDEIVYSTRNSIIWKDSIHKHTEEISSISAIRHKNQSFLLVGNWDGSVHLYVNGSRKQIRKSNLAIKSVFIKKQSNNNLIFIIGDGEGNLILMNEDLESTQFEIGKSPVDIINYKQDSIIVVNSENAIKFDLNNDKVQQRGYLKVNPENNVFKFIDHELYSIRNSRFLEVIDIDDELEILTNETICKMLVKRSIKFQNHLNLSVFVTLHKSHQSNLIESQIEVIENNAFIMKSSFKLKEGIEITDIVNLQYRKDLIDSYNEEDITVAYENVLSQCFVVSCISHVQDMRIPSLQLFTVDETGKIQHQCSSAIENDDVKLYSLTNHCNRLVIGAGNTVACYKIEYSVVNSKFSINKVAVPYKAKSFISSVKSIGPDVLVCDIISGLKRLDLKVKKETADDGLIFKFLESASSEFPNSYFLTNFEVFENIVIINDSLGNVFISLLNDESVEVVSQFRLSDRINVIKKIDYQNLNKVQINNIFNETAVDSSQTVSLFLLGSYSGSVYLINLVTNSELVHQLMNEQIEAIQRVNPISKDDDRLTNYEAFRKTKGVTKFSQGELDHFIDGDLLLEHGSSEISELIRDSTTLL